MIIGFGNNVVSALASEITAGQKTIHVMPGDGAKFAALLTQNNENASTELDVFAKITLTDSGETEFEICHLLAVSGDVLSVVRGQEGTAAKGWLLNDVVANFATRGSENQFVQIDHLQSGFYCSGVAGGSANALTLSLPSSFFLNGATDWMLSSPVIVYPTQNNTGAATLQLTMGGKVLGTFPLYKGNKKQLVAGDILKDSALVCLMDKSQTFFSVINPGAIYAGLGTAAFANLVTSMTDTTAGRVPVVGWEGLGGYALQTADAAIQSQNRLPTRFFIQGNGDDDKRFGLFGAGVHIEYGTDGNGVEYSANMFVRADGNIIVEWLQVNADGSVNDQKQQMLYGPLNLPTAAEISAVGVSGVFARAGTAISDANDLPANAVSFCYADAAHSPGYEATILDVGGLGGYRVQYAVCYADGGKQFKFRTFNGDNSTWGDWTSVITNYGGDVDHLSNASFYHINPAAWPGVGAFAEQYNNPVAPFTIPFGRVTPKDISQYLPIIKGLSSTEEYGFGAAVSFGILRTGHNDFGSAVIHIIGDNGASAVYQFNVNGDFNVPSQIGTGGNIVSGQGLYESGGAVRVYSPNNPPPSTIVDAIGSGGGWQQDSSGLIMQMGIVTRTAPGTGVTFPRAFPNYCIGVLLTLNMYIGSLKDSDANIRVLSHDQNGFSYGAAGDPEQTSFWVAFGK